MRGSSGPAAPPARPRPVGSLRSADLELQDINKRRKAETGAVRESALAAITRALDPKRTDSLAISPTMRGPNSRNLVADPGAMSTGALAALADTGAPGIMGAQVGIDVAAKRRQMGGGLGRLSGRLARAERFEADRASQLEEFIGKEMEALNRARVGQARGRSDNIRTRQNRLGFTGSLIGNSDRKLI